MNDVRPNHIILIPREGSIVNKSNRDNPGSAAVDKVADNLESTYNRVIEALQNNSPFDEQTKAKVKQIMNEFADFKAEAYAK